MRDIRIILASKNAGLEMTSASASGDSCLSHILLLFLHFGNSARAAVYELRAPSFSSFFSSSQFFGYSFIFSSEFHHLAFGNRFYTYIYEKGCSVLSPDILLCWVMINEKCMIRPSKWTL